MKEEDIPSAHWSRQKEKAAGYWHFKFVLILFRFLPAIFLLILAFPVGFFYFVFSKKARAESRRFLTRAASLIDRPETAKKCRSSFGPLRHIISFSLTLVEKLQAWGAGEQTGERASIIIHYQDDNIKEFVEGLENGEGAFVIASHLGNTDLLRGLVSSNQTRVSRSVPVAAIIDMEVTANFSRMLKELNPNTALDVVSANEIGPHTAARFEERLAAGGMETSTGDRTAPTTTSAAGAAKNLMIPFLGEEAPFPQGIFYLAALLKAPVYFVFALRRGHLSLKSEYDMHVHRYALSTEGGRKERFRASSDMARSFAALLERYCKEEPFQWYNFFDFWQKEV
jgi:predicted LPLAT superfamily acyltransferase